MGWTRVPSLHSHTGFAPRAPASCCHLPPHTAWGCAVVGCRCRRWSMCLRLVDSPSRLQREPGVEILEDETESDIQSEEPDHQSLTEAVQLQDESEIWWLFKIDFLTFALPGKSHWKHRSHFQERPGSEGSSTKKFLECVRKPENIEKTHGNMRRTCELHKTPRYRRDQTHDHLAVRHQC